MLYHVLYCFCWFLKQQFHQYQQNKQSPVISNLNSLKKSDLQSVNQSNLHVLFYFTVCVISNLNSLKISTLQSVNQSNLYVLFYLTVRVISNLNSLKISTLQSVNQSNLHVLFYSTVLVEISWSNNCSLTNIFYIICFKVICEYKIITGNRGLSKELRPRVPTEFWNWGYNATEWGTIAVFSLTLYPCI